MVTILRMILISEGIQRILSIFDNTNPLRKSIEKCRIKVFGNHSDFRYQQSDSLHCFPGWVMSEKCILHPIKMKDVEN